MDGVVGLTQCDIMPFKNFTYRFRIGEGELGTFWYHAHSGVQRADGLYGGLIVHKPSDMVNGAKNPSRYQYEAEKLLLIGDWYHSQAQTVLDLFKNPTLFGLEVM